MIGRWLPGLVLTILALASGWLLHNLDLGGSPSAPTERHDPDFYMQNFTTVTMDAHGRPDRQLKAERMVHYPDTDTNELTAPELLLHGEGHKPVHVTAERGWLASGNDVVLLRGEVHIWQDEPGGSGRLEITTRDLRVLPESRYAETDQPAKLRGPWGEARGVGLRAHLDQGRVELLSQVRTVYEPKSTN